MIGAIVIREKGATPKIARREQNRLTRQMLAATAAYHHRRFMKKHFTVAGGKEYGYKPRKGEGKTGKEFWASYTGKKKRQKGHQRPLEWSGESKTLAAIRDIRATRRRARIVQHARGLNRRSKHSDIKMHEEIKTISDREAQADLRFANRKMRRGYREIKKQTTLVIK